MKKALIFLQLLTQRRPTQPEKRYSLTLSDAGTMMLGVHLGDLGWQTVHIDESDFDKPSSQLVDEIIEILKDPKLVD